MENKIKALFELQKFAPNKKLSALISETERHCAELSDYDLENVSAAGELFKAPEDSNDDNKR